GRRPPQPRVYVVGRAGPVDQRLRGAELAVVAAHRLGLSQVHVAVPVAHDIRLLVGPARERLAAGVADAGRGGWVERRVPGVAVRADEAAGDAADDLLLVNVEHE